ncbi:winged helix-turn-helix domain-containing protein [Pelomonas sp. P7]|uniref:Winged helix-turn-helix domain-containing protein n=1 Tax=Pelomonas caseinilytica TaxID=2906763 RepID=A0ABS8X6G2_9BURK|nr:winged helix-turn-helix domain-containing protein [Pelomonas sp. P7]MCE4536014.1 winged helix-turn-helix domain-containing protein [Pelomonas sp. P7]
MLAVHGMPAEACALLRALAAARGWYVRCDERPAPRVQSGDVVVAMAAQWQAAPQRRRPRGLLLLAPPPGDDAQQLPELPGDVPGAVLPWPCEASALLDQLLQLLAPAPLQLDAARRAVCHRGQTVRLTPKECRILQVLLAHAGQAVARETLEAELHAWGQEFESNTLDVHVHRLRHKLPDAGIRAVRGYGYVLIARR